MHILANAFAVAIRSIPILLQVKFFGNQFYICWVVYDSLIKIYESTLQALSYSLLKQKNRSNYIYIRLANAFVAFFVFILAGYCTISYFMPFMGQLCADLVLKPFRYILSD